jgi:hypothetical protein
MSPGPARPSQPDQHLRIDHTMEDIIFLLMSILTLGVGFLIFAKRKCEHSYIHAWYQYVDWFEHISEAEYAARHWDD